MGNLDSVSDQIKKGLIWEKELHDKIINLNLDSNSIVIEAGTHICSHTLLLARLFKTVYSFEPFPETHKIAIENLKLNNIDNVILSNKALCVENDKTIEVEFHNPLLRNISSWSIQFTKEKNYTTSNNFINIKLKTIDSLNLDKLDLIKLDIKGNELNAIKGGINTIKKFKPIIILEDWEAYCNNNLYLIKNKYKILVTMGYKIESIGKLSDYIFYINKY